MILNCISWHFWHQYILRVTYKHIFPNFRGSHRFHGLVKRITTKRVLIIDYRESSLDKWCFRAFPKTVLTIFFISYMIAYVHGAHNFSHITIFRMIKGLTINFRFFDFNKNNLPLNYYYKRSSNKSVLIVEKGKEMILEALWNCHTCSLGH